MVFLQFIDRNTEMIKHVEFYFYAYCLYFPLNASLTLNLLNKINIKLKFLF